MFKVSRNISSESLLTVALSLLATNYVGYQTISNWSFKLPVRLLALALVGLVILNFPQKRMSVSTFLLIAVLAGSSVFAESAFSNLNLLIAFLICYAAKDIATDKFITLCNKASLISFAFYILLLLSRKIHFVSYTVGFRTRNTMGFSNVNAAAQFFLAVTIILVLRKNSIPTWIVYFFTNLFAFRLTDSRTAVVTAISFPFVFCACILLNKAGKIKLWRAFMKCALLIVFSFPVIIAAIQYRFPQLDTFLSGRPQLFLKALTDLNVKQFLIGGASTEVDNGPMCILLANGIIAVVGTFALFWKTIKNVSIIKAEYVAFLSVIILMGMMEGTWIRTEILSSVIMWKILWDGSFIRKAQYR